MYDDPFCSGLEVGVDTVAFAAGFLLILLPLLVAVLLAERARLAFRWHIYRPIVRRLGERARARRPDRHYPTTADPDTHNHRLS